MSTLPKTQPCCPGRVLPSKKALANRRTPCHAIPRRNLSRFHALIRAADKGMRQHFEITGLLHHASPALEKCFHPQLQDSLSASFRADRSKRACADVIVWRAIRKLIQRVECLCPELNSHPLDRKVLEQGCIQIVVGIRS